MTTSSLLRSFRTPALPGFGPGDDAGSTRHPAEDAGAARLLSSGSWKCHVAKLRWTALLGGAAVAWDWQQDFGGDEDAEPRMDRLQAGSLSSFPEPMPPRRTRCSHPGDEAVADAYPHHDCRSAASLLFPVGTVTAARLGTVGPAEGDAGEADPYVDVVLVAAGSTGCQRNTAVAVADPHIENSLPLLSADEEIADPMARATRKQVEA